MPNLKKLKDDLISLTESDWVKTLREVREEREKRCASPMPEPTPGTSRDQFAQWVARQHLASDPEIDKVVYLPAGAPKNEIRLVEINLTLKSPESEPPIPIDFTPDIPGIDFRVLVADVTPDQWEAIIGKKKSRLPDGWKLTDRKAWARVDTQ